VSAVWRAIAPHDDGSGVVHLSGELDIAVVEELERELRAAVSTTTTRLDIDLDEVTYIDSSSVGAIMRTLAAATEVGKSLRVINARGVPRRVLEISGVGEVLGLE
jgi:anti-sigma B factor antagonist